MPSPDPTQSPFGEAAADLALVEVADLQVLLDKADVAYYDARDPIISDDAYDALCKRHKALTGLSWLRAGYKGDIQHVRLMGTQQKAYTHDELTQALGKNGMALIMPKIDGLGLEVTYGPQGRHGLVIIDADRNKVVNNSIRVGDKVTLNRALSRGQRSAGISYGEDVSTQAAWLCSAYLDFTEPRTIRGEVYMTAENFEAANQLRAQGGEKPFKNSRNAAAGIFGKGDRRYLQFLSFVAYEAFDPRLPHEDDFVFETKEAQLKWLQSHGFETPPYVLLGLGECTEQFLEHIHTKTWSLPYETDGLVLVLNDGAAQRSLGYSREFPRFAAAYKFKPKPVPARVTGFHARTTRTGRVMLKYLLEPTEIGGATVKQATGNNWAWMKALGAKPGDLVGLVRCGEVIPRVEELIESVGVSSVLCHAPAHCPSCKGPLVEDDVDLLCMNEQCAARLPLLLVYACGKKNLDIDGVGESLADALVESNLVVNLADFLDLGEHHLSLLAKLELGDVGVTFGAKRAQSLVEGIGKAKGKPWKVVLHSLGCPGLGEPECAGIAQTWGLRSLLNYANMAPDADVPNPREVMVAQLITLKGMGAKTAEVFIGWLVANTAWLEQLPGLPGWRLEVEAAEAPKGDRLAGLTLVVTGVLSKPRPYWEGLIKNNGGIVSGSVSKKTSYLLAGADAGSKLAKAQAAGVTIIDEAQFLELLNGETF